MMCSVVLVALYSLPASCVSVSYTTGHAAQPGRARWSPSAPPMDLLISSTSPPSGTVIPEITTLRNSGPEVVLGDVLDVVLLDT